MSTQLLATLTLRLLMLPEWTSLSFLSLSLSSHFLFNLLLPSMFPSFFYLYFTFSSTRSVQSSFLFHFHSSFFIFFHSYFPSFLPCYLVLPRSLHLLPFLPPILPSLLNLVPPSLSLPFLSLSRPSLPFLLASSTVNHFRFTAFTVIVALSITRENCPSIAIIRKRKKLFKIYVHEFQRISDHSL